MQLTMYFNEGEYALIDCEGKFEIEINQRQDTEKEEAKWSRGGESMEY